jgi:hypothetical protein
MRRSKSRNGGRFSSSVVVVVQQHDRLHDGLGGANLLGWGRALIICLGRVIVRNHNGTVVVHGHRVGVGSLTARW